MDVVLGVIAALFFFGLVALLIWARRIDRELPDVADSDSHVTDDERRARQLGMALNGPLSTYSR